VSQLSATLSQQCNFAYAHWSAAYHDPLGEDTNQHSYAHVRIVGRPSEQLALVSWGDSRRGRYGDQVWTASTSKHDTVCILTGVKIRKGDSIYSVRRTSQAACNYSAAILASAIQQFPLDTIAD
jgi:hypothetical protein